MHKLTSLVRLERFHPAPINWHKVERILSWMIIAAVIYFIAPFAFHFMLSLKCGE